MDVEEQTSQCALNGKVLGRNERHHPCRSKEEPGSGKILYKDVTMLQQKKEGNFHYLIIHELHQIIAKVKLFQFAKLNFSAYIKFTTNKTKPLITK